ASKPHLSTRMRPKVTPCPGASKSRARSEDSSRPGLLRLSLTRVGGGHRLSVVSEFGLRPDVMIGGQAHVDVFHRDPQLPDPEIPCRSLPVALPEPSAGADGVGVAAGDRRRPSGVVVDAAPRPA